MITQKSHQHEYQATALTNAWYCNECGRLVLSTEKPVMRKKNKPEACMTEWEAIRWKFTSKGDRIIGFCGHSHRSEQAAKKCATMKNARDEDWIWVAGEVVYYDAFTGEANA